MLFDHNNIRKALNSIDKKQTYQIYCNKIVFSICAANIFTQILKKELIKYQIEFKYLDKGHNLIFKSETDE